MIENITQASPAAIDTRIAAIHQAIASLVNQFQRLQYVLDSAYSTEQEKANASVESKKLAERHYELDAELLGLSGEYLRRGGWTRYYLVQNTNGHVHVSTNCTTCFADTSFGWLTQFSGTEHDEMGRLSGMDACAVCFPNLPAEVMQAKRDARVDTPERIAAREQREIEQAAKKAKAAANGITAPDGTPLKDDDGYVIKTLRSAQIKAVDALEQAGLDEIYADQTEDDPAHASRLLELAKQELDYASRLIEAIAAKQERPAADVEAELTTKATKKLAPARKDEAARKAAGKTASEWYATK